MARIRTTKPEFWTSDKVAECDPLTRLMFIGMWNFADDEGRMEDKPKQIKMRIFPGDDISAEEIAGMLQELSRNQLILLYTVENKGYIQVKGWDHQKISKPLASKFPAYVESPPGALPERTGKKAPEGKGRDSSEPDNSDSSEPDPPTPKGEMEALRDELWKMWPQKKRQRTTQTKILELTKRTIRNHKLTPNQLLSSARGYLAANAGDVVRENGQFLKSFGKFFTEKTFLDFPDDPTTVEGLANILERAKNDQRTNGSDLSPAARRRQNARAGMAAALAAAGEGGKPNGAANGDGRAAQGPGGGEGPIIEGVATVRDGPSDGGDGPTEAEFSFDRDG